MCDTTGCVDREHIFFIVCHGLAQLMITRMSGTGVRHAKASIVTVTVVLEVFEMLSGLL
jgi:hypothetical protein